MESTFSIIAEPSRRAILSLLADAEQSVGDLEEHLHLSQPAVSKHLRVLREAGLVREKARGRERFYRLDPNLTSGVGGTGLGLYICRELVGRMGGRIWVDSREGEGSRFTFELPVD